MNKTVNMKYLFNLMWGLTLVLLVPVMLFIILIIRPIIKKHYEPKWITKWYEKTGVKWFY